MPTNLTTYCKCSFMPTSLRRLKTTWQIPSFAKYSTGHLSIICYVNTRYAVPRFRRLLTHAIESESNPAAAKIQRESSHSGGHVMPTPLRYHRCSGTVKERPLQEFTVLQLNMAGAFAGYDLMYNCDMALFGGFFPGLNNQVNTRGKK